SRHRSSFFTAFFAFVRQPFAFHSLSHAVIPLRKYSESVKNSTWQGSFSAASAAIAAFSSSGCSSSPPRRRIPPASVRHGPEPPPSHPGPDSHGSPHRSGSSLSSSANTNAEQYQPSSATSVGVGGTRLGF